ncbi:MAG: ornithine cyclodeaminase family protein [Candidatus Lambdaproteobacteria bacterium]|nr:ornithine cyclodeaminase family protein [Candidatus Lambdaproteobacteria bacterium]
MGQVRILSEAEVKSLVSPLEAQRAVEQAFQDFANGISRMAARITVNIPDVMGNMRILPAVKVMPVQRAMPPTRGFLGVKIYTGYVGPVFKEMERDRFTVLLHDLETGTLLAVVAARYLGALRTGATAAVATKYMANPGAQVVCVVGAGEQGETQVTNMAALLKPRRLIVADAIEANLKPFAAKLKAEGVTVETTTDTEQAVRAADIVCTSTTSRNPVLKREWLKPGVHINAIGANLANRREVDAALIKASRVVVEYREQALQEAGDLVVPIKAGELTAECIAAELGDVVTGKTPGRTSPLETTLFKSIGVAIEDISVAAFVFDKARVENKGTVVAM